MSTHSPAREPTRLVPRPDPRPPASDRDPRPRPPFVQVTPTKISASRRLLGSRERVRRRPLSQFVNTQRSKGSVDPLIQRRGSLAIIIKSSFSINFSLKNYVSGLTVSPCPRHPRRRVADGHGGRDSPVRGDGSGVTERTQWDGVGVTGRTRDRGGPGIGSANRSFGRHTGNRSRNGQTRRTEVDLFV